MIERLHYLDRIIPFVDTELIKVITGVRRSGKSMMLKQVQNHLIVKGVQKEQIININFEEMRNESLLEYRALNNYLEESIENLSSKAYIFLDEIQEVASFERVINSLRASYGNMVDIYITGSNAKLLSGELATFLSGRYVQFEIYPFTLSEYIKGKRSINIGLTNQEYFNNYLIEGGMPFPIFQEFTYTDTQSYLSDIYNSIILKDIVERENIREPEILRRLLNYVLGNIGRTFSARSIVKYFKSEGINSSINTIINYLTFAQSAYAIIPLRRYDIQGKKLLQSQEKYYVVDHGLRQAIIGRNEEDIELVLENIVLLELMARGYDVYVGKSKDYEVDFVAEKKEKDGLVRKYIQVSYLIATPETREREFRSLKVIEDNFEKLVLSLDPITLSSEGISHYNLIDWLLDTK